MTTHALTSSPTSPAARGEFLVFDDGFRSWRYTYAAGRRAARAFAARLDAAGIVKGDKVILWGENRPEWIVGVLGLRAARRRRGARSTTARRATSSCASRAIVEARLVLVGEDVQAPAWPAGLDVWPLAELLRDAAGPDTRQPPPVALTRDDVAEIIFTSGATAEPKGVVITHRNILANIVPIEQRGQEVPEVGAAVLPAAVPEPAAAQPHVRPVDGDLRAADAAGHGRLHARLQPARDRAAGQRRAASR